MLLLTNQTTRNMETTLQAKKPIVETLVLIPIYRKKGGSEGFIFECRIGADNYKIGQVTNKVYKNEELPTIDPVKQLWFSDTLPEFRYQYDKNDKKQCDFAFVLQNHMLVDYPGNKNLANALFKLVDIKDQKRTEALKIKKMGAVYNKLNNLTAEQMRDVAFRWGLNAKDKTIVDIFIELSDFSVMASGMTKGVLMRSETEMDSFLKLNLDKEFEYTVVAKKAIIYGVFVKEKNNFYYYNSTQIGNSEEDVVKYCKDNAQIYEGYVKKEVANRDVMPSDVDYSKSVESIIDDYYGLPATEVVIAQKVEKANKNQELIEKAKGLGIKNPEMFSDEELQEKILKKETPKAEVKNENPKEKEKEPVKEKKVEEPVKVDDQDEDPPF